MSAQFVSLLVAFCANIAVMGYQAGKISQRLENLTGSMQALAETSKQNLEVLATLRERVMRLEVLGGAHATADGGCNSRGAGAA